jgi:tetratricopeptide (TPR) repeat protein
VISRTRLKAGLLALILATALTAGLAQVARAQDAASTAPTASAVAKPADANGQLSVRASDHGNFDRVVFDWPHPVTYAVQQKGDQVKITFNRPIQLDAATLRRELPADVSFVSAEPSGPSTVVMLKVPANATLHHFAEQRGPVVLDIYRADAAAKPPVKPEPAAPATKPAATAAIAPTAQAAPASPAAPAAPTAPAPTASAPGTAAASAPAAATATSPPAVAGAAPAAATTAPTKAFAISVSWDQPVGAAIFQRAGYLWLVFDKHQDVDIKLLRRLGGEAVTFAEQMPSKAVTILRLILQPDYKPSVRREGLLWIVDLTGEATPPSAPIDVLAPARLTNGTGMALAVKEPGNVIDFVDPEVGDTIVVVPVGAQGAGVYPGRDTPDVQLLPTLQGIAIVPHTDAIDVKTSRTSVTVALPAGRNMLLSAPAAPPKAMAEAGGGLFDVSGWRGTGGEDFNKASKEVTDGLLDLSPSQIGPANLRAAQFYFANGYAAECLGFLRLAAAADPTTVDTAPFRSLRGACSFLMGRYVEAQGDLDNPLLKDDGEAQLWRAAAHAAPIQSPAEWSKPLASGLPLLKNYPKPLKWPLAEQIAKAALADSDDATGRDAIAVMAELATRSDEKSEVDYLTGALEELKGQFDRAIANYDRAKQGDSREYRARAALAQTELLLRTKKINAKEAADRLDRLRFSWREGDFEFNLLRRLAELQVEAEEYPEALRTFRTVVSNYSDNPGVAQVKSAMSDTFTKLYLNGAADGMAPVAAIGLYDEFRDLTPTGPPGDEMIRKLADRLVKVDLLDRAAALLKYQVGYRLKALDKARVGSQLALLDLMDKRPSDALDALTASNVDGLPPELVQQRHHLQARALADLDRGTDAIAALKDDTSREAQLLRAEIFTKMKDWTNAADVFAALVPEPDRGTKLSESDAQLVLNWATALTLGKDDRGLATLRRVYGPAMEGTSFQAAFELLTSAPDKQVTNFPGLADKIKQAQDFKTFIASYKEKVQASGLSSIN